MTDADAVPLRIAVVRRQAPDARVELGIGLEAAAAGKLARIKSELDALVASGQVLPAQVDAGLADAVHGKGSAVANTWDLSIFRNAAEAISDLPKDAADRPAFLAAAKLDRLGDAGELSLMRKIAVYPRQIEAAALAHEPHRVAFYLYELASEFHAQWTRGTDAPHLRFIIADDRELTLARLALVQGAVTVLASGLALLGVEAPVEMR